MDEIEKGLNGTHDLTNEEVILLTAEASLDEIDMSQMSPSVEAAARRKAKMSGGTDISIGDERYVTTKHPE